MEEAMKQNDWVFNTARAVGHTWTAIQALKANPKAIMVCWNYAECMRLADIYGLPRERFFPLSRGFEASYGRSKPIVFDTSVVQEMIRVERKEHEEELQSLKQKEQLWLEEQTKVNKELLDRIDKLNNQLEQKEHQLEMVEYMRDGYRDLMLDLAQQNK